MEHKGSVRIYADMGSQPSRAVITFCKMAKIPHEIKNTLIFKGQQKHPDYLKLNPYGQVPTIQHLRPGTTPFVVYESHAIMRYLCTVFKAEDHWYPSTDLRARALIDQYLDTHHSNLRRAASVLFPTTFLPMIVGFKKAKQLTEPRTLEMHQNALMKAIKIIENNYLGDPDKLNKARQNGTQVWIASVGKHPSLADLSAFCELDSINYMPSLFQQIMSSHPKIKEWYERMLKIPEVNEVHTFVEKSVPKFLKKFNQLKKKEEAVPKL